MNDADLLAFAKRTVGDAAARLASEAGDHLATVTHTELDGREPKLVADAFLDDVLVTEFSSTGLPIVSEESGSVASEELREVCWVIDPLDGSVNYSRKSGPSAISVALCRKGAPIFGVLYSTTTSQLSWGGRNIGAWCEGRPIHVSRTAAPEQATICGGVPARFRTGDRPAVHAYFETLTRFSKVRMVGSAASSLLMVACGAADAYYEEQIMWWDVAAGLALVEGAGGEFHASGEDFHSPYRVVATNGAIGRAADWHVN